MTTKSPAPPTVAIGTSKLIIGKTYAATEFYPRAVDAFYGVPYARVSSRFRAAVPLNPGAAGSSGFPARLDASEPGSGVQPIFTNAKPAAEKTLTLNIFRPSLPSSSSTSSSNVASTAAAATTAAGVGQKFPVVVYVHGGGFNFGEPLERDHVSFVSWAAAAAAAAAGGGSGPGGVMVVSICYRLGALGFLAGQDENGSNSSPQQQQQQLPWELNLGLKDQRLAVEWVKQHIGAFGGDGNDLTLMGVSAGAHSIGHHILDPRRAAPSSSSSSSFSTSPSHPLFSKAILESGSATARSVLSATHPRMKAHRSGLRSSASVDTDRALETLGVAALLQASVMVWAENQDAVTWPFQPVVEDVAADPASSSSSSSSSSSALPAAAAAAAAAVIPDTPLKLWDRFSSAMRKQTATAPHPQGIAVITGFCSHEGTSFVPAKAATNADFRAFFAALIPSLSAADLDALERLYPDPVADPASPYRNPASCRGKGAQYTRLHEAYAHYAYICPILHTAHTLSSIADNDSSVTVTPSSSGASEVQQPPAVRVYVYEYAAVSGMDAAAGHGDQASTVAHDMVQLYGRPGLQRAAGAMHARWAAFAASRDGTLPAELWPEFKTPFSSSSSSSSGGGERGKILVFGKGNDEKVPGGSKSPGVAVQERILTEREMRQCRFWWERMELSQGRGERAQQGGGGDGGSALERLSNLSCN